MLTVVGNRPSQTQANHRHTATFQTHVARTRTQLQAFGCWQGTLSHKTTCESRAEKKGWVGLLYWAARGVLDSVPLHCQSAADRQTADARRKN